MKKILLSLSLSLSFMLMKMPVAPSILRPVRKYVQYVISVSESVRVCAFTPVTWTGTCHTW